MRPTFASVVLMVWFHFAAVLRKKRAYLAAHVAAQGAASAAADEYMKSRSVEALVDRAVNALALARPKDHRAFLAAHFAAAV